MSNHSKKDRKDPEKRLLTAIHEVSLMGSRLFNQAVKEIGLTRTQWMVIYQLYLKGEQSQTEIARSLSVAKPPLGKVIDLLEKGGWLTRMQNPNDRRENLIRLTDKVEPLIAPLTSTVTNIDQQVFQGVSPKQQASFVKILDKINANMRAQLESDSD